ncbi:MAG TPA: histidine kinase N-terminal 7TM domain-containing protein, partial [Kineosporiaceae bacterium]|nr:histidine kinase N-terminal 7TM domain-containing protein [Kineosporiaceae bacterium]
MSRELVLGAGLALGGLGYLALAWYVWRYRAAAGGRGLLAILLSVFVWTTFYALELSARTVPSAELWSGLKYIGVVGMPPSLLAFSLEYTGRRGLSRRALGFLTIEPLVVLICLVVPGTRYLVHSYNAADRAQGVVDHVLVANEGTLFWPHAIYSYSIAFFALGLVVVRLTRIGRPYRRQASIVVAAALLPLLGNIAYNAGLFGLSEMDPVPFLFTLLAVVLVWGFFRLRLLDLVPVARGLVLEQMVDAVLVLDAYDRVVDANPAAAGLLAMTRPDLVGRYISDVFPTLGPLLDQQSQSGVTTRWDTPLDARGTHGPRDLAVTLTTLVDRGAPTGRLIVLNDVTERQSAQRRLHELLDEQTRVADTLQAGLRPTSLPDVEGVRMAVRSLPAGSSGDNPNGGRRNQVSGDFYDVHRVLGGDWAFVLGDVSGKGVEAAVVTSMARYTVRTLSAEGRSSQQVLEQLNRALLTDEMSERFCTVVYGRIDGADLLKTSPLDPPTAATSLASLEGLAGLAVPDGSDTATIHVTLTLGGHPRPLLRRRDGEVTAVGTPGTALGLVPRV